MALKDLVANDVTAALREFDELGREAMLERYGNGPRGKSKHWYIVHDGKRYDQKVTLRAAHELTGLGPLPPGKGTFKAREAKRILTKLGFRLGEPETRTETPSPGPPGQGWPRPPHHGTTPLPEWHDSGDYTQEHGQ